MSVDFASKNNKWLSTFAHNRWVLFFVQMDVNKSSDSNLCHSYTTC